MLRRIGDGGVVGGGGGMAGITGEVAIYPIGLDVLGVWRRPGGTAVGGLAVAAAAVEGAAPGLGDRGVAAAVGAGVAMAIGGGTGGAVPGTGRIDGIEGDVDGFVDVHVDAGDGSESS